MNLSRVRLRPRSLTNTMVLPSGEYVGSSSLDGLFVSEGAEQVGFNNPPTSGILTAY